MKSIYLRNGFQNHVFGLTTLAKPDKYWLNVYSSDPGLNPTWLLPAAIFSPREITDFSIADNIVRIAEEIQLGPVPTGQTSQISFFVLFGQFGIATPSYSPLFTGQFRATRTVPEGDFLLFTSNSIVFTEV